MQVPAQNISKKKSKMDQSSNEELAPKRAIQHFSSTNWHKLGPRPEGTWIKLKPILFDFLEIRTLSNSHFDYLANFSNILASIIEDASKNSAHFSRSLISPLSNSSFSIIFSLMLKTF